MSKSYIVQKALVTLLRQGLKVQFGSFVAKSSNETIAIPSRDAGRSIKAYIYHSKKRSDTPPPVLLNFHGGGFTVSMHGSDDAFCAQMAAESGYTVLDVTYRLSPEYRYPAALNDVEDAIRWALSQPDRFDRAKVALSGFSAGGYFALVCASAGLFPAGTFSTIIAVYPPVDLSADPRDQIPPDTSGDTPPTWLYDFFANCYVPPSIAADRRIPRISPIYADPSNFPDNILLINAACDSLCPLAEALVTKLRDAGKSDALSERMEKCDHAWDKAPLKAGSLQEAEKNRAYALAAETLRATLR